MIIIAVLFIGGLICLNGNSPGLGWFLLALALLVFI